MSRLRSSLLIAMVLVAGAYVTDILYLRLRMSKNTSVRGVVQVLRYYAVPEKNNREEFYYDPPDTGECVHSLFPHLGDSPCWFTGQKKEERIDE